MARTYNAEHEQARGFYIRAHLDGPGSGAWNMIYPSNGRHGLIELLPEDERRYLDRVATSIQNRRERVTRSHMTRYDRSTVIRER